MGTICASAHANIFMGKVETLHIYPYLKNFSTFYCRFIHDIIFLWNRTESELIKFIYSNAVYVNFSTLEKVKLLSTFASVIIGKILNHKPQF